MQINVLFFASLRDEIGRASMPVDIANGSLSAVYAALDAILGPAAIHLHAEGVRVAVNHEMADAGVELHANDEVAFLPPMTGG